MSGLIYHLGRGLGYATIPALRKSKQVWRRLAGRDAEAIRAETEFGRALAAELRLNLGVQNESDDTARLTVINRRLMTCLRNKTRTFQVEVLRHPDPAALALPGGFVFPTGALLELCERNGDVLAFILGHEMAHVVLGHAMERMLSRVGAEGLSSLVSRGLLGPAFRESSLEWLQVAYGQEAELEADEFAVRVARAAGYQPAAALDWLKSLEHHRNGATLSGRYLTSHPPESERMAHIQRLLRQP
jgi:predicted Zn-dependent protease